MVREEGGGKASQHARPSHFHDLHQYPVSIMAPRAIWWHLALPLTQGWYPSINTERKERESRRRSSLLEWWNPLSSSHHEAFYRTCKLLCLIIPIFHIAVCLSFSKPIIVILSSQNLILKNFYMTRRLYIYCLWLPFSQEKAKTSGSLVLYISVHTDENQI